jgi:hypothetical protein
MRAGIEQAVTGERRSVGQDDILQRVANPPYLRRKTKVTDSLRSCEKIGSQAKAPAPLGRKFLCVNVGQTLPLPSANPVRVPIFSQLPSRERKRPAWAKIRNVKSRCSKAGDGHWMFNVTVFAA